MPFQPKPLTLGNFVATTAKTFALAVVCFLVLAVAAVKLNEGSPRPKSPANTQTPSNAEPIHAGLPEPTEAETELKVGSRTVRIGETADDTFAVLNDYEVGQAIISNDPQIPGGLIVAHTYEVDHHSYIVMFRLTEGDGPYRVASITKR